MLLLALPTRGEPLVKWVEPPYTRGDTRYAETYWLFSSDYDSDLCCWVYEQHQITLWEFLATEIPPRIENEDEEP